MTCTTTTKTADELRAEAAAHEAEAHASFERCDTDGFLSQWASGLSASKARLQATIVENGGVADFLALFTVDGTWVPAKVIDGNYGPRWMVLDGEGRRTGTYLPYLPARRNTLASKGYLEGYVTRPAKADFVGRSSTDVRAVKVATDRPWDAPLAIVSTDRWADES